jgi:hypothetical protein
MATFAPSPPRAAVECDVRGALPDVVTVGMLARLELIARRNGNTLDLRNASPELLDVVAFMGLDEILKAR